MPLNNSIPKTDGNVHLTLIRNLLLKYLVYLSILSIGFIVCFNYFSPTLAKVFLSYFANSGSVENTLFVVDHDQKLRELELLVKSKDLELEKLTRELYETKAQVDGYKRFLRGGAPNLGGSDSTNYIYALPIIALVAGVSSGIVVYLLSGNADSAVLSASSENLKEILYVIQTMNNGTTINLNQLTGQNNNIIITLTLLNNKIDQLMQLITRWL